MVKDHSDIEKGNPLPPHRLLFPISSKGSFYMHHPTNRIAHTTAFVTPVVGHWLERDPIVMHIPDINNNRVYRNRLTQVGPARSRSTISASCHSRRPSSAHGITSAISISLLTCTFREICYNTHLSWAHTPVNNWAVGLEQKVSSK